VIPLISIPYFIAAVSPNYRYDAEPIKVSNQRSHRLNPRDLISFAVRLPKDETNTTFICRGKSNQKNEPHKDKEIKHMKPERRKTGGRRVREHYGCC
jgi:hypothetical protein